MPFWWVCGLSETSTLKLRNRCLQSYIGPYMNSDRMCDSRSGLFCRHKRHGIWQPRVHGEFVIEVRRGGDPAPLLLSPMLGKLLVHEKCDFSDGASAGQTGRSPGNWRDPSRSR